MSDWSAEMLALCESRSAVGSRVTCNPPITNTDEDWLCLTSDWRAFLNVAVRDGYTVGGSVPADELERRKDIVMFNSMRRDRDNMNLIVTDDPEFAQRFLAATSVAIRFNLQSKEDRIALFQAVLYGNACEQV